MYEIPAAGGTPRELIPDDRQNEQDATWSADGKRIAYAGDANDAIVRNSGPGDQDSGRANGKDFAAARFARDVFAAVVSGWTLHSCHDQRLK